MFSSPACTMLVHCCSVITVPNVVFFSSIVCCNMLVLSLEDPLSCQIIWFINCYETVFVLSLFSFSFFTNILCSNYMYSCSNYSRFYMYELLTKREVKMAKYFVSVHKHAKKGQYRAILTEQAWSIKDILQGIKHHNMVNVPCGT